MNPISDNSGKSDEIGEVHHDGIDASRRPSHARKRSTDCPESINKDTLSQVNKGARQTDEVIEIDSNASELKYNATHARIRARENHEKNVRKTKSNIEKTVSQDSSSSSHKTAYDQVHQISAPSCLSTSTSAITEQSSANWSRMMEFGKEMKRARKRKVRKLDVSTKKNNNPPRIVENIMLSPSSRYDTTRIARNKNEKETNVSNRSESNDWKQDAIDESLDLSDAKLLSETDTRELFDKGKADCSKLTYPTMNTSYITLEEGRQIGIINVNNGTNKIVDENIAKDSQNRHREENAADYRDSSLQQKELTLLTPEKPNESVHEHEIIRNVSQTSADNFGSSSCLPAEKRTPGPRETNNVQETSNGAASSQFQSWTPNKARLSLKRKPGIDDNKCIDSPPLSELPLSHRFSIGKHEEYIARKIVDSPVSKDDELFDRLKVVKRDLNFKIRKDQQRIDRDAVRANVSKNIIEVKDNNGNVSGIVRKDRKLGRNFTGESTVSKKSFSTKSKIVENQGRRSLVKFTQSGSLIRRLNVRYFFLGTTKRELSMPAEVRVSPVYNMQQSISRSEVHVAISPQPWNDMQNSSNIVMENISFTSDSNSNEVISKEFPATSICRASATPEKDIESRLNKKKSAMIVQSSTNANQRSDKSVENVAEKVAQSPHRTSRPDTIHRTISRTHPGTSNSIKLLSPDKDSQLKFLKIDSPMSERKESRRANLIKLVNERNNFSEKNSCLAASTSDKAQESFIKNPCKKRKRIRCANDKESFDDESSDGSDDSNGLMSDSSRTTIIRVKCSESSKKAGSSRLDANKKRRLSSSDDQDIEVISVSKKQDAPERKFKTSSSDTESESATHATKNLKRYFIIYDPYISQYFASYFSTLNLLLFLLSPLLMNFILYLLFLFQFYL